MFCSKCGTKISGGSSFCPSCGKRIKESSSPNSPSGSTTKKVFKFKKIFLIIPIILAVLIGGYFIVSKFSNGAVITKFNKIIKGKSSNGQTKFNFSLLANVENFHLEEAEKLAAAWSKGAVLCGFAASIDPLTTKDKPTLTYTFCDPNQGNGYHVAWYDFAPDKASIRERPWSFSEKIALPTLTPSMSAKKAAETAFQAIQKSPNVLEGRIIKSIDVSLNMNFDFWYALIYVQDSAANKGAYVGCTVDFDSSIPTTCKK